jgi:hypothetical protein
VTENVLPGIFTGVNATGRAGKGIFTGVFNAWKQNRIIKNHKNQNLDNKIQTINN